MFCAMAVVFLRVCSSLISLLTIFEIVCLRGLRQVSAPGQFDRKIYLSVQIFLLEATCQKLQGILVHVGIHFQCLFDFVCIRFRALIFHSSWDGFCHTCLLLFDELPICVPTLHNLDNNRFACFLHFRETCIHLGSILGAFLYFFHILWWTIYVF